MLYCILALYWQIKARKSVTGCLGSSPHCQRMGLKTFSMVLLYREWVNTVAIHAFIPVHSLGSSTLFGLAVRFQHVGLQSSHGGGAPRIFPLPISSRTYDLIHCASASATNPFFFFFFLVKKAYMSIDANYISNPRD